MVTVAVTPLLDMPDHLLHHHQVTEMRVTRRHKAGQDVKLASVTDCVGDRLVIALTENNSPLYERDFRKIAMASPIGEMPNSENVF